MSLWNWLPSLKPRHTVQDVAHQLIEGLQNGDIVLDSNRVAVPPTSRLPLDATLAKPSVALANSGVPHYTIDDAIVLPLTTSVEVTVDFGDAKRWLFFVTPSLLATVGDWVPGTRVRMHLGERHMVVVNELTPSIIDAVLRQLHARGELEDHTRPFE